jgi:4-amino-4-deoxy-L-arabinose transferase-like glycosyltransferase
MRNKTSVIVLLSVWSLIYLINAGGPPALLDDADTVHAEAAREMAASGDWVTLRANGIRYLEKAPLMYWGVALSYKIFGVSEFSSRLPIALAVLALMFLVNAFGTRVFGERTGFLSALILGSCIGIFLFTRVLWPDVILTLFTSIALYCFVRAIEDLERNSRWVYGIYAAGALGVLTKGLIGAAFPALIIVVYLLVSGDIRKLFRFRLFTGTLLFLAIAAPWHIAAGLENPGSLMSATPSPRQGRGFFWFYFMNEHFLRYVGLRYPQDYDTVPLPLFLGLHLLWLFPWTVFLPLAFDKVSARIRPLDFQGRVTLLLWLWLGLVILFFCFSTTQEYYTMPAYPALALLIGKSLARTESGQNGAGRRRLLLTSQIVLAVIGILIFAAGTIAFIKTASLRVEGDISDTLTRNPEAYALSLGHVLDLTPQSLAKLRTPVALTAVAFLAGPLAALYLRLRSRHFGSDIALTSMMVILFFAARVSLVTFEPYLSSRNLADAISRHYKDGDAIVINGEYEGGSSINFYTRKQVYILNGRTANLEYGSYFSDAPPIFLDDESFGNLWRSGRRTFLVTDALQLERLRTITHAPVVALNESGGKLLLTNQESQVQ